MPQIPPIPQDPRVQPGPLCVNNLTYLLEDPSLLSQVEYKVLQSCSGRCFARCMTMLYNGKLQLLYLTGRYRPLAGILPHLPTDSSAAVLGSLFDSILQAENTGFLRCENIDLSFDHIFVDPATCQTFLVYLPLAGSFFPDRRIFENELRSSLEDLVRSDPGLISPGTERLFSGLKDPEFSLAQAAQSLAALPFRDFLALEPLGMAGPVIMVSRESFIIGRSRRRADGLIRGSRLVGRMHCRISRTPEGYYAEDLNSANGTYINGERLTAGTKGKLCDGDILRIADRKLRVSLKRRSGL